MIEKNISQLNIMTVVFNVKEVNRNSEIILLKMIQNRIKIKNKKKVQQEYTMLTAKGTNTNTMDIINIWITSIPSLIVSKWCKYFNLAIAAIRKRRNVVRIAQKDVKIVFTINVSVKSATDVSSCSASVYNARDASFGISASVYNARDASFGISASAYNARDASFGISVSAYNAKDASNMTVCVSDALDVKNSIVFASSVPIVISMTARSICLFAHLTNLELKI